MKIQLNIIVFELFHFAESTMNLQEFIDMTAGEGEGQVMDYKSFIRNYTSND